VGHVEAGLRTYDRYQPYPEEMNRRLTAALADLHFAPTATAMKNLLKENIPQSSIFVTGNTGIDMIRYTVRPDYEFNEPMLRTLDFSRPVIVMTAHRMENLGQPMKDIANAVLRLVRDFTEITIVFSMHPNPAVREVICPILAGLDRILMLEPWDVSDMHNLIGRSKIVLTDSGGLQEEAPALHKPVVVMRNVTERPEGVEAGVLMLAGTDADKIYGAVARLLTDEGLYKRMASVPNPFGDGYASERILEVLAAYDHD